MLKMLKLSNSIIDVPILSLRTGSPIATATKVIMNPNNLKIEGWFAADRLEGSELVLVAGEVRDVLDRGIVVNDHEVLSPAEDLVRLKETIEIGFELIGKAVTTESGKRLGKVADFAVETEALIVKKIYVGQSLIKNFSGGTLSIDRTQIIEITDKRIIVEEPTDKAKAPATASVATN